MHLIKGKPVDIFGLIIVLALSLCAFALTVWAWIAVKGIAKVLANGFEGIHFDL